MPLVGKSHLHEQRDVGIVQTVKHKLTGTARLYQAQGAEHAEVL